MRKGMRFLDYASFLIEAEPDLFQEYYLKEWNERVVAHLTPTDAKRLIKVHALGAGKGGRRRYVLTAAGTAAQQVYRLPFVKWAEHLSRADVRATLYESRDDTFERLCVALENAETRNNIESFKVARRTKSVGRDAGGRGVRYGSRKSDVSSKVYRRGKQIPAIETQVQDDKLDICVLEALEALEGPGMESFGWDILASKLSAIQDRHFNQWFFSAKIDATLDRIRHEDIPVPQAIRQMYQVDFLYDGAAEPEDPNADNGWSQPYDDHTAVE